MGLKTYTSEQAKKLILSGKLPPNTIVEGYLDLNGCTYLQSLPDGLKVEGWLGLYGCTSLQYLSNDLKVVGWLYLKGCPSLQLPYGIPEGVKGEVWVDEEVLRNNKEHLLTMVNTDFGEESKELYKKILAEG